jgi:hypothetical protein
MGQAEQTSRVSIITAVQTPLGFFVLVVLIVEVIFGMILLQIDGADRTFIIRSMIGIIIALVLIVAGIAVWRPSALTGKDPRQRTKVSLLIGPPEELKQLDITKIIWNNDHCYLVCGENKEKVTLVPSRVGPSFHVRIPDHVLERIQEDAVALDLKDAKGNAWSVRSFYVFENLLPLSLATPKEKIMNDYAETE